MAEVIRSEPLQVLPIGHRCPELLQAPGLELLVERIGDCGIVPRDLKARDLNKTHGPARIELAVAPGPQPVAVDLREGFDPAVEALQLQARVKLQGPRLQAARMHWTAQQGDPLLQVIGGVHTAAPKTC